MSRLSLKALQAAAGAASGEAVYVDDVFSTYLYDGNSSTQAITNNIVLGDGLSGGDYTNVNGTHYLTKSGDLTGNTDGKSCTVSCWIKTTDTSGTIINNTNSRFVVRVSSGKLNVYAKNTSDVNVLNFTTNLTIAIGKWVNVLFSFDLSSSSNRSVYINDVEDTSVTWSTYNNENIDRASTGTWYAGLSLTADLAHIFQSNSYTDLSVEANRRNFITSDKLPTSVSAVSALSPILYLPLTSDYTIGKNLGTGGDFTTSGAGVTSVNNGVFTAVEGKGGLVWIKQRNANNNHLLIDTERGATKTVFSNSTYQEVTYSTGLTSFNSDGFTLGTETSHNSSGINYASWTFRKQPGFFDVVTYTGDGGVTSNVVSHNLGSTPGSIWIKRLDTAENWVIMHRNPSGGWYMSQSAPDAPFGLNTTNGAISNSANYAGISSTSFQPGGMFGTAPNIRVDYANASGGSYVAYLFAHDVQDFGTNSDEAIIKCGSYTTDGSGNASIDLGFEPQFILAKRSSGTGDWFINDTMRGIATGGNDPYVVPNTTAAENSSYDYYDLTSTGFKHKAGFANSTYIYVAIRRPHKPASEFAATDLFDAFKYKDNTLVQTDNPIQLTSDRQTGGPAVLTDMWWHALRGTTYPAGKSNSFFINSRLQGAGKGMITNGTNAEPAGDASEMKGYDRMTGVEVGPTGTFYYYSTAAGNRDHISYYFRRAPGFFDVVAYTGTGTSMNIPHSLGVVPELIIVKRRNVTGSWFTWQTSIGTNNYLSLNTADMVTAATTIFPSLPTSSQFTVGTSPGVSGNTDNFVAYLFATVPGISKVGTYTGTGSAQTIDCGFSNGARFVLSKVTSGSGNWFVFDSERGITASLDPYLIPNQTAAEATDSQSDVNPDSTGFVAIGNDMNRLGDTYIFLAIA